MNGELSDDIREMDLLIAATDERLRRSRKTVQTLIARGKMLRRVRARLLRDQG